MPNILDRVRIGVQAGLLAAKVADSASDITDTLDQVAETGILDAPVETKEALEIQNKLKIFRTSSDLYAYHASILREVIGATQDKSELYPHGDPQRDFILADYWKREPILSGAVYSMSAKMSSLSWQVIGKKRQAQYYAGILTDAVGMNGLGWGDAISATAQDFYTTDRGAFWITPRAGSHLTGRLLEVGVMDALSCAMTGNMRKPVLYSSRVTGQDVWLRPGEYAHFVSMVSPREEFFGQGFCAVSRAYNAARILLGLSRYDWEKLNNLPPEGLAAISGLTQDEFQDSLALWRAMREKNQNLTYPQVLWLLGSQPNTTVAIDFQGFSQIPESFDRKAVVEQYVNTLALVFGVDAREFWPISSSSLGTAAESEIQHMKAKGKGPGEFISIIERYVNGEMPEGVTFGFDTQDIGEDQAAATVAKAWIDAFMPLYIGNPSPQPAQPASAAAKSQPPVQKQEEPDKKDEKPKEAGAAGAAGAPPNQGEPLITRDEFMRLLADRNVIPHWLISDDRSVVSDTGLQEKEGDDNTPVIIRWKEGVLTMERQPAYTVIGTRSKGLPMASIAEESPTPELTARPGAEILALKQLEDRILNAELERAIRGNPLPDTEALRGPRITKRTVAGEIERWRAHPVLSKYVPTPDESEETEEILDNVS